MKTTTQVAITSIGAASVAGAGVASLSSWLSSGERQFVRPTRQKLDIDVVVASAPDSAFALPRTSSLASSTGRLCLTAAQECLKNAAKDGALRPDGLVLGTSTGGQSENERAVFALHKRQLPEDYSFRSQGCMAAPARLVARELEIQGHVQTVSTACTSSANAIALGAAWIAAGRCRRVLVGGGDALCYTTLASFHILELTGAAPCRPFGRERPGMTLGEGAGFLLLEPLATVRALGREPLALLLGVGMSSDAHHMTAPAQDGAGAELAMRRALASAALGPERVEHINAHGTGTQLNDAAEAEAISRVFGANVPVMSCKGVTGHTLGGAGALEAVASVLAIRERRAFPNAGATEPGPDCRLRLVPPGGLPLSPRPIVLSSSFAFGGNNCALLFGAAEEA